jgi:predicted P-loop ATPase
MIMRTLVGAVRRIYEPGCKHDAATVLMGPQGCGKSTFWRNLGGPFFSDALRDINSKDDLLVLHRSWLMEWAELDHITGKRHAGQVKAFLSQQIDTFRVPYGKGTEDFPRRGIIVGSTNRETGFLVDDTGNRRFWVVPVAVVDMIEVDDLLLKRDAIWAAAVLAYRSGVANHLPAELEKQVAADNANYQVESPWLAPVREWIASPRNAGCPITTEILLTDAIGKPVERQSRADQMQVASICYQLGLKKRRKTVNGVQKWVFCQPDG